MDPIQRLRLLRNRIPGLGQARFHSALRRIFTELRDPHTAYLPPADPRFAILPVRVERYVDEQATERFVVSAIAPEHGGQDVVGAEVTHWNGVPIDIAVDRRADTMGGSNPAARRAMSVALLTVRPLAEVPIPDEEWVDLTCRTGEMVRQLRLDWIVLSLDQPGEGAGRVAPSSDRPLAVGVNFAADLAQQMTRQLFARADRRRPEQEVETFRPELRARVVSTPYGEFGHLQIFRFIIAAEPGGEAAAIGEFLEEVRRLLTVLPQEGLVLDVRANGGGYIDAAEPLLQFLTPRPIQPEPFQFRNTRAVAELSRAGFGFQAWSASIDESVGTGAQYSGAIPFSADELVNGFGQVYHGPVVLIVDAVSYSATDIFAAGFQDHGIGPVLGVDPTTGAGGATVLAHSGVDVLPGLLGLWPDGPLRPLPGGANFRMSLLAACGSGLAPGSRSRSWA